MVHDFEYCTGCGLCHSVYNIPFERDGKKFLKPSQKNAEFLKKMNDICPFGKYGVSKYSGNVWGEYISACRAYSADNGIRRKASSGGVITSLAIYLLRTKKVDGVILTKADENMPYHCVTFCARTEEEILSACGSRYSQSSPLMDILSLIKHDEKYCFIGKPCDVSTLRRYLKYNPLLENRIVFMLSFFCAGMPSDQANEKLLAELDCKDCVSLNYRGNGWPGLTTAIDREGIPHSMYYQKSWMEILGRDIRKCCKFCFDGIGESADISCGDFWNIRDNRPDFSEGDGYNIVFARNSIGQTLLTEAAYAGSIVIDDMNDCIDKLKYCQPNHYNKRTTILGKIMALRIMRKKAPRYNFLRMLFYAREGNLKSLIGSFKGTVTRCINNRL